MNDVTQFARQYVEKRFGVRIPDLLVSLCAQCAESIGNRLEAQGVRNIEEIPLHPLIDAEIRYAGKKALAAFEATEKASRVA